MLFENALEPSSAKVWNEHRLGARGYNTRILECCQSGRQPLLMDTDSEEDVLETVCVQKLLRRRTVVCPSVGILDVWPLRAEEMQQVAEAGWVVFRLRVLARAAYLPEAVLNLVKSFIRLMGGVPAT